jgi:serine/threonine-protein kinase
MKISSTGGAPQALSIPNVKEQEVSHRWPQILPGNEAVLFTIQLASTVSYDDAQIAILSLKTGKWHILVQGGFYARYIPSGHVVYAHGGSLMAVPFDSQRLEITGSPVPVQEGVVTTASTSGGAEYDVSGSGLLAYVPGNARPPARSLVWVDRTGKETSLPAPQGFYSAPRLSPDGKRLALQLVLDWHETGFDVSSGYPVVQEQSEITFDKRTSHY